MSDYASHFDTKMGSERGFGLVFSFVFLIVALWPVAFGPGPVAIRWWAVVVAALFVAIAYLAPALFSWPNKVWLKFGLLLGAIISPITMSVVFFLTVLPTGLVMRAFGKDLLCLRLDRQAETYWVPRTAPVGSMREQF